MNKIYAALRNRTLFTGICSRLLLGKSRTAQNLTRLSRQMKFCERLERRYAAELKAFDDYYGSSEHVCERSNRIWVCWFQGMDEAPELVQKCFESIHRHLPWRKITLITEGNMSEYVDFPDYIIDKWKNGVITNAHMSDLLRLALLVRYGGTWMDATVFCSGWSEAWNYVLDSDLFFYQMLRPGRAGHTHFMSSWLITACTNNKILMAAQALLYKYWENNDDIGDYFLFHDFFGIVLKYYKDMWYNVMPAECSYPGMLQYVMFKPYDAVRWEHIKALTPFHKLTYKFEPQKAQKEGTYYRAFMDGNLDSL